MSFKAYKVDALPEKRGLVKKEDQIFTGDVINMLREHTNQWFVVAEKVLSKDATKQKINSARASLYSAASYRKNRHNSTLEFAVRQRETDRDLVIQLFVRFAVDKYDFRN
jgi:hypothetical protein